MLLSKWDKFTKYTDTAIEPALELRAGTRITPIVKDSHSKATRMWLSGRQLGAETARVSSAVREKSLMKATRTPGSITPSLRGGQGYGLLCISSLPSPSELSYQRQYASTAVEPLLVHGRNILQDSDMASRTRCTAHTVKAALMTVDTVERLRQSIRAWPDGDVIPSSMTPQALLKTPFSTPKGVELYPMYSVASVAPTQVAATIATLTGLQRTSTSATAHENLAIPTRAGEDAASLIRDFHQRQCKLGLGRNLCSP